MNDTEAAASRSIHSGRRAISEAVVERQYALRPELRDRYGERGREKCVEDTQYRLAHLSGALLASSPALFADYISWASGVMTVASVRAEDVRENLACLRDILGDRLPGGQAVAAAGYVESALGRLAETPRGCPASSRRAGLSPGSPGSACGCSWPATGTPPAASSWTPWTRASRSGMSTSWSSGPASGRSAGSGRRAGSRSPRRTTARR